MLFPVSQALGDLSYDPFMTTKTLPLKHSMNLSPVRLALLLIPFVLACFVLSPKARAVDPPPVGGYSGQNTATGEDALFSLTLGTVNTLSVITPCITAR